MTIGLSPTIDLGPLGVEWHGLLTAAALLVGLLVAESLARARGMDPAPVLPMAVVVALAGVVGARLYYLAQEDPARLLTPWSGATRGFAFYGAVMLAAPAAALALRLMGRPVLAYLDVAALAFPAAMVVGRLGDLINGEHYGPPTDLPWGVTYTSPEAHVPETGVAYHSGALYEIAFVAMLGLVVIGLHRRLRTSGDAFWLVLGAYSLGRFVVFFWVRDVEVVSLGLRQAQWTSAALVGVALAGYALTHGSARSVRRGAGAAEGSVAGP